ncbi:type VI secretion system tip protein TssI/VgrG [Aquabacterium sp. A7-Y]|uniref:type VI secretion system Vgr family protein n=1 Tax=Aquabacterium sp. A7-Y TaxID=1349605 RepID=UPI00223C8C1C|nr:type VI secretion system tip protein TssI/VgrG [Aquabacterium sp. A7-Y]MCW7539696.1 type VI secretion system tip protein TssI/VgrG [Aquabacterium sp. A7-Y]
MPTTDSLNEARFLGPVPGEELLFRRLQLHEELGRLPEFRLELLRSSQKAPLRPADLLGRPAAVALRLDDEKERFLHGLIVHVERGGHVGRFDLYWIVLRPWLWQLTLGSDCRIFQDMTVLQILDAVFAAYPGAGPVEKPRGVTFTRRPYTVQYNESDFNFILRLMEDEGLYFHFRHERDRHVLVLCSGAASHRPTPAGTLRWNEEQGVSALREDVILQWSRAHSLQPLAAAGTDFAAESPDSTLMQQARRTGVGRSIGGHERYAWPAGHDDLAMTANLQAKRAVGEARLRRQVDRFDAQASIATGITPYRALTAGQTFEFAAHDDAGAYLVTGAVADMEFAGYEANTDARSTSYSCRFNAVPKALAYQPPMQAERVRISGPQTAIVVGPAGEELHVDRHGRVKVQFHWDRQGRRDERSSCWVRVSHPWAGKGFGMIALPRVGDEVIVEFLDGWPDRPIVTGRVYNGANPPPYPLPERATVAGVRTRSSRGGAPDSGNELRFQDALGEEHVWLKAQRDLHQWVGRDQLRTVLNDEASTIAGQSRAEVGGNFQLGVGGECRVRVDRDAHATLGADLLLGVGGAVDASLGGGFTVKADGGVTLSSGGALNIDVAQAAGLSSGAQLSLQALSLVLEATTQISLRVGASFITIGPEGVSIMGPQIRLYQGGVPGVIVPAVPAVPAVPQVPEPMPPHVDPLTKGPR